MAARRLLSASSRSPASQHKPLGREFSRCQPPVVQDYILKTVSSSSWLHAAGWYSERWRISQLQSHVGLLDVMFLNSEHSKNAGLERLVVLCCNSHHTRGPNFCLQLTRLLKYFLAYKRCLFKFVLEFQCPRKQVSEFSSHFQDKVLMEFSINLSSPSTTSPSTCGFCRGLIWVFFPRRGWEAWGGNTQKNSFKWHLQSQAVRWLPAQPCNCVMFRTHC